MEYQQLFGFDGIQRNTSDFLLEDGEFVEAENLCTPKIGVLKKTGDYAIKGSQITASQDILGGIDFQRNDGTHDHLVAIDGTNSDIYYYTGGTWSSQTLSRTAGEKIRFAYSPTLDHLFACNISDDTTGWNGSSWSTSTNLTDAPKAKYPIMFGRRLYLANVDLSATRYRDRLYRSSLVDSGTATWDTTNDWLTVDDIITGVGKNGQNMFIGCQNSIWIFTLSDEKYQVSSEGCISHESIAEYSQYTFWANRNGMYAFDGSTDTKISNAIQEYWDAIPEGNLSEIQAEIIGNSLCVYIGDISLDGKSLDNVLFIYDIQQNNWNRVSLADEVKHLHSYITSSGKSLFMGNDDGEVFEMFTGEAQNTSEFSSFLETPWFYGSGPRQIDDYYEVFGYGDKLSGLKVSYKVDDDDWRSIGSLNGSRDFIKFKTRGYRMKLLLSETSKNNLYELHRIDVGFEPRFRDQRDKED